MTRAMAKCALILALLLVPRLALALDIRNIPNDAGIELWLVEDHANPIVSVAFGLRNVADTDRGLREMARVCQPGGRVAILEFSMPRRQPFKGLYGWYFRHILPRVGQFLARNSSSAYEYLPTSVGDFPAYDALVARMLAAGLREATYYPLTFGIATLYVGQK